MDFLVYILIALYCAQCHIVAAYLLPNDVHFRPGIPPLPQFTAYGKSLVLVGGGLWDNNTEIYEKVVTLAGGKGVAKIGIITAASADPLDGYNFYRDQFRKFGALETNRIPVDLNHTGNAGKQEVVDLIYSQTGFFFGGGDQDRVVQSFIGTLGDFSPALLALHQMFDSGAVIAGTSAGTTCQTANYMIKSGVSYEALLYGSFADVSPDVTRQDAMVYSTVGGLGFLKGYVLDTHFSQRGREGRMIRMLADTRKMAKGTDFGIGVDENTALVVTHADTNRASGEVIGANGVSVFDLSTANIQATSRFHLSDLYMTYLTHGDVIRLSDRHVTFSSSKTNLAGHENYDDVLTTNDVFYGSHSGTNRKPEFVRIATSVFDARRSRRTYGTTHETHPRFRVDLSGSGSDAEGWVERKSSFHSDIHSYKNLRVDIYEG